MAAVPGIYFPLRRNARGKAHESLFLPKGGGCGGGGVRLFAIAARRAVAAAVVGCCCCGAVGFLLCPSGGWSVLHIRVPNLKARAAAVAVGHARSVAPHSQMEVNTAS